MECSQHIPNLPRFPEFDPRKKIHQLTELLRQKNYEAATGILNKILHEHIPIPGETDADKDNLQFYSEEKAELAKATHAWIHSDGTPEAKHEFFNSKSEVFCCFLHFKISALADAIKKSGKSTRKLQRLIDEYDNLVEDAAELEDAISDMDDEFEDEWEETIKYQMFFATLLEIQSQSKGKTFVIPQYESPADFLTLRPDFASAGESQKDNEEFIQNTIEIMRESNIPVERKTLHTSNYLRWLVTHKKKNDPESRAAFLVTPTTIPMESNPNNGWILFPQYI